MKALIFSVLTVVSTLAHASIADSCIWKGEEHLKKAVLEDKLHWLEAAYTVHKNAEGTASVFEGVGSCRFVPRNLGETADAVVANYLKQLLTIIPTRAYINIDATGAEKIVIASGMYSKSTNYLFIKKDFYNTANPEMCAKQMDAMIAIGQGGQDLDFADVEIKANEFDGVTAVINANSPDANYLGVCSFHSIAE